MTELKTCPHESGDLVNPVKKQNKESLTEFMKKKSLIVSVPEERIASKIFLIRGKKVMLDRDLAELYGVETRVLNQAVRRNIKRFPEDFMISLTREEIRNLSQIVISSKIKHAPSVFVFTEQGVAMLSSVLNSERAIQVNIQIMRAFTKIREVLTTHNDLQKKLEEHDTQISFIFKLLKQLLPSEESEKEVGFA